MADETTDSGGIQQLALCVRNVNEKKKSMSEVCKDFFGFTKLKLANAENITEIILAKLSKWGVAISRVCVVKALTVQAL